MPMMKMLQNLRLDTLSGSVLRFKADEPLFVPNRAVAAATARGAVMVDPKDRTVHDDLSRLNVDFSGELRQSLLFLAVSTTMKKNSPKDFNGGGSPTVDAIEKLTGFPVAESEITPVYQLWHQVQDGGTYNVHPDTENVQRVMEAGSKAELLGIADEMDIGEEVTKGLTNKELHKLLLSKLSGYVPADA